MSDPRPWLCPVCVKMGEETKLGVVENDIIRIKRKDLYVEFKGTGQIVIKCWKCGATVIEETDDYKDYLEFLATPRPGGSSGGREGKSGGGRGKTP